MSNTRKLALALLLLAGLAVAGFGWLIGGLANAGATYTSQPTFTPPTSATTGPVPSTTGIVQPSAVTGQGPEAFTTLPAPGPVQVLVTKAECVKYVGDGWWITWKVTNQGQAREGALMARIDNTGPEVAFVPNLQLAAGGQATSRQVLVGGGDSVVVTWANSDRPVQSFPFEVPHCPQDPADLADARRATTST